MVSQEQVGVTGEEFKAALIESAVLIEREMRTREGDWEDRPVGAGLRYTREIVGLWAKNTSSPKETRAVYKRCVEIVGSVMVEIGEAVRADKAGRG